MLRVRWRRAEGPVTAYRVHCTKIGPAPAWVEELDAALENRGGSPFRQELDTVTARTETYFNNGFPVLGAPYRCSVTPTGPNGDGASVVASVVVAPVGSDLAAVGPALEIASMVQISGALSVSLTDESAAALVGAPVLHVRCIDVATGDSRTGFRGADELSSPVIVGGVIAGHQYDCVASAPVRGVSAVVRSAVIAQVAAGVPAAPQSAWVQGRSLGKLSLVAVATGVQTPGTALGLSVRCVERSTGRVEAGTEAHTFDGTNSGQWFWVELDSVAPGTWDCAFAFVNDRGAGPSLSVAARVDPKLSAPTGFTYLEQDGANGVFRVKVQADAWDAGGERALGVGCMNLTDNSLAVQDFNLDELEQTVDGVVEFRVPVTPGAPYRCEYTVYLDFSGEATLGLFGVPYEFTAADSRSVDPARSENVAHEPDDESMMLDPVAVPAPPSIVDSSVPSADAPDLRIMNAPTPEPSVPSVAADSPPVAPQAMPPTDSALVVPPARPDDVAMPGA